MINRVIGSYRIVDKIGAGGMGLVFRAVDQAVHRNVAIKVLRLDLQTAEGYDAAVMERFRSEARAMAKLNHPAIATLYAFLNEGEECFLVMEYVPGRNLAQVLESRGSLPWQEACEIVRRVLEGLHHAHIQGVVHRDLKPSNILLSNEGTVKITDFGIARVTQSPRLTAEQSLIGTPEYMAPELVKGQDASAASDIYSMGVVLWQALVGRSPFSGLSGYSILRAQVEEAIATPRSLNVEVSEELENLVMAALSKDPKDRPETALDFANRLASVLLADPNVSFLGDLPAVQLELAKARQQVTPLRAPVPTPVATPISLPSTPATPRPAVSPATPAPATAPVAPVNSKSSSGPLLWGSVGVGAAALLVIAFLALRPKPEAPVPVTPPPNVEPVPVTPPPQPVTPAPVTPAPVKANPVAVTPNPVSPKAQPAIPDAPPAPAQPPPPLPGVVGATTTDAGVLAEPSTLAEVHTIYIRPAPEKFETILADEIRDKLKGSIQLAGAQNADAVVTVVFQGENGATMRNASDRLDKLKGTVTATIAIRTRQSGKTLWSAAANDKRGLIGGFGSKTRRLASRLAEDLRDALKKR